MKHSEECEEEASDVDSWTALQAQSFMLNSHGGGGSSCCGDPAVTTCEQLEQFRAEGFGSHGSPESHRAHAQPLLTEGEEERCCEL